MDTRVFCVYNQARRVFLSSKVMVADGVNQPLKMLKILTGLELDAESGLWLTPLNATPMVARLFQFDLAYLDRDNRVLEMVEVVPGVEFPPYHREVASALFFPLKTLGSTHTECGDQLVVCEQHEADELFRGVDSPRPALVGSNQELRLQPQGQESAFVDSGAAVAVASQPVTVHGSAVAIAVGESTVEVADLPMAAPVDAAAPIVLTPVATTAMELPPATSASGVEGSSGSTAEFTLDEHSVPPTQPIVEHVGLMEDLFANWVESPAAPPSWIVQKAHSIATRVDPATNGSDADVALGQAPVKDEAASEASAQPVAQPILNDAGTAPARIEVSMEAAANGRVDADHSATPRETAVGPPQAQEPVANRSLPPTDSRGAAAAPVLPPGTIPVEAAIPQPAQTAAFTVAQCGRWQVSTPTAVSPIISAKRPVGENVVARVATKADVDANPAKQAKVPEGPKATGMFASSGPVPSPVTEPESNARVSTPPGKKSPAVEATLEKPKPNAARAVEAVAEERKESVVPVAGEIRDQSAASVNGRPEDRAMNAAALEAKAAPVWPKNRNAESASDSGALPAKPGPAEAKSSTDWLTSRILEATQKAASATARPDPPATLKASIPASGSSAAKAGDKKEAAADAKNELSMTLQLPRFLKPDQKGKLKISIQRVESNGKKETKPDSFGTRFKRWLNTTSQPKSDRRRAYRRYVPGMVAHYYTGGAPRPHDIADISMTGFYVLTQDRWMPDTMIQMTLQKPCAKGERKQSISVLSKIVRRGTDGVAAEFVMAESLDPQSRDVLPSQATDRFALARFI